MESMLFDPTGKQLMAEAVYLYGVMLTLMDCKIDGAVRERILVAYYRVKARRHPPAAPIAPGGTPAARHPACSDDPGTADCLPRPWPPFAVRAGSERGF